MILAFSRMLAELVVLPIRLGIWYVAVVVAGVLALLKWIRAMEGGGPIGG